MAVYVDDTGLRADVPGGAGVVRGRWSHLFADTEDELRAFAATIGLKQDWIQHPGQPHVHFDVTARMRQRAIAAGAAPLTWRQAGEFFTRRARRAGARRGQALRQAAHLYLGHGLLPVPGWGVTTGGGCCCPRGRACPRPGKHPRSVHTGPGERDYSWKPLTCHTHDEVDRRFADDGPYATGNLMLAIPPGLLAIDQDDDDGGPQAIAALAARLGDLPATLAHQTPHGVHRLYRTPPGWTGRAWVGKDTRNPLPPGVDLRVPGQILMAAPSQVPAAGGLATYGPVAEATVADLPAAYLTAWTPPQPQPAATRRASPVPPDRAGAAARYVHHRVGGILTDLAAHQPGGRNTAIYTAALKVGSTLGAARTTPGAEHAAAAWTGQAAEDKLMEAAEANGYIAAHGPAAARSAIRSGLRNGLRNPRPLPAFTAAPARPAPQPRTARSHRGPGRDGHQATPPQPRTRERATAPAPETGPATAVPAQQQPRREPTARDVTAVLAAAGYTTSSHHRGTSQSDGVQAHPVPGGDAVTGHETGAAAPERGHQTPGRSARTVPAAGYQVTSPALGNLLAALSPPPGAQLAATVSPEQARRTGWAAVAADEAYRVGDLGRARQLISHAADLDPARAGLWDTCHREITAKQLLTQADAARQDGDHDRAGALVDQCRELDPRLEARWHRHLTGIRNGHITHQEPRPATEPEAGHGRGHPGPPGKPQSTVLPARAPACSNLATPLQATSPQSPAEPRTGSPSPPVTATAQPPSRNRALRPGTIGSRPLQTTAASRTCTGSPNKAPLCRPCMILDCPPRRNTPNRSRRRAANGTPRTH
jgi:hypothetical protein